MFTQLQNLKVKFIRYFPEFYGFETKGSRSMSRNSFIGKVNEVSVEIQEDVIELQNDQNYKDTFESGMNHEECLSKKSIAYPKFREIVLW